MSDMRDDIRKIKMGIDKLNCCNTDNTPLDIQPIVDELVDNNAKTDVSNTELGVINNSLDTVNTQLMEIDTDIEATTAAIQSMHDTVGEVRDATENVVANLQPQQKAKLRGFTVGSFATKTMKQLMQAAYAGLDITKVRSIRIFVPASTTTSVSIDGGATNMKLTPAHIFTFECTLRDTILTDLANMTFANSGPGTEEITIWFEIY